MFQLSGGPENEFDDSTQLFDKTTGFLDKTTKKAPGRSISLGLPAAAQLRLFIVNQVLLRNHIIQYIDRFSQINIRLLVFYPLTETVRLGLIGVIFRQILR